MAKVAIIGRGWGSRAQAPRFQSWARRDRRRGKRPRLARADRERRRPDLDHGSSAATRGDGDAALEAGKHVLSEKPTARDCRRRADSSTPRASIPIHSRSSITSCASSPRSAPPRAHRESSAGSAMPRCVRQSEPRRSDARVELVERCGARRRHLGRGRLALRRLAALSRHGVEAVQATLADDHRRAPFDAAPRDLGRFRAVNLRLASGAIASMSLSAIASGPDEPSTITIYGEKAALRLVNEECSLLRNGHSRIAGNDLVKRPGNSTGGAFGSGTLHLGRALKRALDDGDRTALAPAARSTTASRNSASSTPRAHRRTRSGGQLGRYFFSFPP